MLDSKIFVLVHGAWHGGWCYSRVRKILQQQGHDVFTPTLSGLAEHCHHYSPAINASTHIQDIMNLIKFERLDNVILAGHSYGGLVVTGVADRIPDKVSALVYLDAFVGKDGCSCLDLNIPEFQTGLFDDAQNNDGHTNMPIPAALFGVNEADQAWVDGNCTRHPFATFTERLSLTGDFEEITNKTYVCATQWNPSPFKPIFDQIKQQPGWTLHEFDCGHDVMVDKPAETARILLDAAGVA